MKKNILIISIVLVFGLSSLFFRIIDKEINPILLNYAESETITISTYLINETIKNNLNINIEDIIETVLNSKGEIIAIDFNTTNINKNLYELTHSLSKNIKLLENNKLDINSNYELLDYKDKIIYNIPIGVVFGNSILSNLGPKIPVEASLLSDISSDIKTEVIPYGINNSLIKVYVLLDVNSMIVLPFTSKKVNNKVEVLLGMKVVQGNIPKFYGSVLTESSSLVSNN